MSFTVLILAPYGRDSAIAAQLAERNGIEALVCESLAQLVDRLAHSAGAVLLTEEALATPDSQRLANWVAQQPSWSDIPFIVLTNGSRTPRSQAATQRLAELGNVVLLARPLHAEAMLGALRSSLKARARQYEVRHAAALSAAQNRILELAVKEAPLKSTLDAIVREVEGLSTSGVMASILLLDPDGVHLRLGSGPSLPRAYNDAIDGIAAGPAAGSCGTAVHRNEPVFVADIANDPLWAGFRDLALGHGLRACWSLPIMSNRGKVLGSFAMYHRQPREPAPADLEIVDFVVRTAGIVIGRAQAENSLRASEARYRQIVEGAEDFAIVTLDAEGTITGWSSGAELLLGHSTSEALSQPGAIFFTDEDRAAGLPEREMERASRDGRSVNERWHVKRDGARFWGSGLTMPLARSDGGFVKIFRDRTAEHEAEAALRASEARLRFFGELEERLFNSSDATQAMHDAAEMLGQILGASRCAYADVDADNDSFWIRSDYHAPGIESSVGTYSLNLFGPRAAADMRAGSTLILSDVAQELQPGEGREMFQAIGIAAIVCCPLVRNGGLAAMMAVHQHQPRDWTATEIALIREAAERCWAHVERVGAEARLRESEERLRLAVENAEVGFWDVDIVNDRLIWPARTKAMFGISPDVPVTMEDFYEGLHPDDRHVTQKAFLAATDPQSRALYDVDYRTIGKEDGVERWVAAKGRGLFDEKGRCLRVAGTALDITARKQAEQALQDLNATLEARIADAIAGRQEAHEALRQSQKMEAMGQLTGGVAHDFNNLLTPIVGVLDMLQRRAIGGEREQRLIAGAAQSAERARVLVQRLLAFARRQPLQAVPVDLGKLVSGMRDLIESTVGPQIQIVVETQGNLPPAKADPNQLEMALLNLSVNARDAMPGGGTLRISTSLQTPPQRLSSTLPLGKYLRLCVSDTGSGMDEATLSRAIEPFFSTKGVGQGTGLGLSMAHGLASQLHGALTIESRIGAGTTIELWLPISAEDVETAPSPEATSPETSSRGIALLVDDDDLVRMSTADMLSDLGYVVVETNSAEEAVRILDAGQPADIVVTDHLMPGMTGTELAHRISVKRPELPILLVSGYAELEGIDAGLRRLTKPFRKDELAHTIDLMVE